MPIRKFDRIFDDGRYTGKHACTVECYMCGKQICFDTFHGFGDTYDPPEVRQNGFIKALKADGYDYMCRDHVEGFDYINTNNVKEQNMSNVISFDAEKASRYIEQALAGFINDPADSDFQRGYLAALLTLYEEGLGKGFGDDRLPLLHLQMAKPPCK